MEIFNLDGSGKLVLNLHPGQSLFWDSDARFSFMFAGKQSGKTALIPFLIFREIYGMGDYKGRGEGDYLCATASYDFFKLKLLPELQKVLVNAFGVARYWAGDKVLEMIDLNTGQFRAERASDPMFARVILRSAQSDGGLESATAKAAFLDETGQDTFTLEDWEAILGRVSLNEGRVFGVTTLYNMGWLKTEVYDLWKNGDPDFNVVQFPSYWNPAFPKQEYDRLKTKLSENKFAMQYDGQFARPSGMIYKDFSDQMLVDSFPVPSDWTRIIGLDFGGANTCKLWIAQNPDDNRWYIYDCSLSGDLTTREHVEQTKEKLVDVDDYTLVGGSPSETQQRIDWIDNGLDVSTPSISNVESGIDRVIELFKTDRIRVFRDLKGIRDELGRYSRKLDSQGEPTHIIKNKRMFHRLDALRYAAIHITDSDYDVASGNLEDMIRDLQNAI